MTSEKPYIRIAIPAVGSGGWLGGISYIENMIVGLRLAKGVSGLSIHLLFQDDASSIDLYKHITPLCDGLLLIGEGLKKYSEGLAPPSFWCSDFLGLKDKIDFVFPINSKVEDAICSASWIPDFQHHYLPQFFTKADITDRNNNFRIIAEKSKVVVFSSNDAHKDFQALFPNATCQQKILRFHTLVQQEWVQGNPLAVQAQYKLPDSFILCCNQFWIHKNHLTLFEAFAEALRKGMNSFLVCTGSFADYRSTEYYKLVQTKISELGLENHVRILGTIPRIDQIQLIRRAALIVQPSLFEGWSTVIEDCRALGKRMLVSDLAVHREQAPPHTLYFNPYEAKELSQLLIDVVPRCVPGPEPEKERTAAIESGNLVKTYGDQLYSLAQLTIEEFKK